MHKRVDIGSLEDERATLRPVYGGEAAVRAVPRYEMPEGEMSPDQAYNLIHDELALDGNARLNLATFVIDSTTQQGLKLVHVVTIFGLNSQIRSNLVGLIVSRVQANCLVVVLLSSIKLCLAIHYLQAQ